MAPRPQRRGKGSDALKRSDHDPHVVAAVANLYRQDGRVAKARAVACAPDIGDLWASYYRFELEHGNTDTQTDVLRRCVAPAPKHGERWQAITKAVVNSHLPVEALLQKAVVALAEEENHNVANA